MSQFWVAVALSNVLVLSGVTPAFANLGDTPGQIAARYGNPIAKTDTFMFADIRYRVDRHRFNDRLILVDYEFEKCSGERIYASTKQRHFSEEECLALATQITGQTKWTKQDPEESGITWNWNSDKFVAKLERYSEFGLPDTLQVFKWGPVERPQGPDSHAKSPSAAPQRGASESKAATKTDVEARVLKWHQELADKGNAYGEYRMGLRYLNGDGVPRDSEKARSWLEKSAAHGDPDAATVLKKLPPPAESATANASRGLIIQSAKFGLGKNTVDVTDRVRELLRRPEDSFTPGPKVLKADVLPGKRKQLVIRYEFNGAEHVLKVPETKSVRYRDLENHARN